MSLRDFVQAVVYRGQRRVWRILNKLRKGPRMWDLVDSTGIVVFVGPNGSGKSLAAVHSTLRTLDGVRWQCDELGHHHNRAVRRHVDDCLDCVERRKDPVWCPLAQRLFLEHGQGLRHVYSTVPLLVDGEDHWLYRPLVDFRSLVTIEHADVLFDEVAGVSDSSDSQGLPVQVTNWLHQLRRRDVRLRVTTPAYARCSKPIRQIAQLVVDARSFFPEASVNGRLWRPRRGMLFSAYDAVEFEDYTSSTKDRVKAKAGAAFWRPASLAERSYDTNGAVLALGHVTDGGMCAVCGGARSRPRCACSHETDGLPIDCLTVVETVSGSGTRTRKAEAVSTF
jgi:hypothetical protein